MCDEANRVEKPGLQSAAREDAATATPQVAPQGATRKSDDSKKAQVVDSEFARAENEDDDGYDPYSDRRPVSAFPGARSPGFSPGAERYKQKPLVHDVSAAFCVRLDG